MSLLFCARRTLKAVKCGGTDQARAWKLVLLPLGMLLLGLKSPRYGSCVPTCAVMFFRRYASVYPLPRPQPRQRSEF